MRNGRPAHRCTQNHAALLVVEQERRTIEVPCVPVAVDNKPRPIIIPSSTDELVGTRSLTRAEEELLN